MAAVLADGHVPLEQVVELLLGVDGTLEAVVEELPGDCHPCGVGEGVRLVDVAPNFLGHGGVEPGICRSQSVEPLRIVEHGGDGD